MKIMKKEYLRYGFASLFLLICGFALLISCGGSGGGGGVEGEPEPGSLKLGLSQNSVKTDNAGKTTVIATVLDEFNAAMEGITVAFSTTGGQLSASSADTDANGEASVEFQSGPDRNNRTETITAEISGVSSRNIPVLVTGTTITLVSNSSSLVSDVPESATAALTITVLDAGSSPVYGVPVTVAVEQALSTGATSLSPSSGNTDFSGELEVAVTGTMPGDVWVKVEAQGAEATIKYEVGAFGSVFGIFSPAKEPIPGLNTDGTLEVWVSAPAPITSVVFGTTVGVWDGGTSSAVTKTVSSGLVTALLSSIQAGLATVQVTDASDSTVSDTLTVAISAPSSESSQIALQASSTTLAPSTGDVQNTISLQATVKNATDQVVGGAPVSFVIMNPTGGGESVSPAVVYTDFTGVATTTFNSGSLSSGAQGVTLRASVIGMPTVFSEIPIIIGGIAGSIVIGVGTTITSNPQNTAYIFPISVLVTDSGGNPVQTSVTLSTWPTRYRVGYWSGNVPVWWTEIIVDEELIRVNYEYDNEDINRNLILDNYNPDLCPSISNGEDVNGDCQLTPPISAAGAVPVSVETDDNGVGNFNLVYLKQSAIWIETEITASTLVLGTETRSTYKKWLHFMKGEEENLPHSPYCHPLSFEPCF